MKKYLPTLLGILLLGGVGALLWSTYQVNPVHHPEQTAQLEFEPIDFDANAQSKRAFLDGAAKFVPTDPSVQALLSKRQKLGVADASKLGVRDSFALDSVRKEFIAAAVDVAGSYGPQGYGRVGELVFDRFREGVRLMHPEPLGALNVDKKQAPQLALVLSSAAWDRSFTVLGYVGDFMATAEVEGFIDSRTGALDEARLPELELVFRYLWVKLAEDVFLSHEGLTAQEIVGIRRWQIEKSQMPLEKKLALLEKLEPRFKGYDSQRAMATLKAKAGDLAGAKKHLEVALENAKAKGDAQYTKEIEVLLQRF